MKKLPLAKDETLQSQQGNTCSKLNYIKYLNSVIYNAAKKQNKNSNWSLLEDTKETTHYFEDW